MSTDSDAIVAEIEACFRAGAIDEETYKRLMGKASPTSVVPKFVDVPIDTRFVPGRTSSFFYVLVRCIHNGAIMVHSSVSDFFRGPKTHTLIKGVEPGIGSFSSIVGLTTGRSWHPTEL